MKTVKAISWVAIASVVALAFIGLFYTTTLGNLTNKEQVCATVTHTETVTITVTQVLTLFNPSNHVQIVDSSGRCGVQEKPKLEIVDKKPVNGGGGYVVVVLYSEPTSVPCYRHVLDSMYVLKRYPPIVEISLRLEATSEICVECVGVVNTLIKIGSSDNPIPEGTEIRVNGLSVVV